MITEEKASDMLLSVLQIGKNETAEKYSITLETINRYLREARKENSNVDSILELASMYSPDELKMLTSKKIHPSSQASRLTFEAEQVRLLVITDTHIGSRYTVEDNLLSAIDEGINQGCSIMVHAGDVTEGMSGRDGHVYELSHIGYREQRKASIDLLSQWPKKFYAISGNHDLWYAAKGDAGGIIVEDICHALPDGTYLGEHEGDLIINGAKVRLWHGEDTGSYAISYRLQKLVESFSGGEKPNVLICGHTHKFGYIFERNCHILTAGSIQKQSAWMRRKRLAAHCGFTILTLGIKDSEVVYCEPKWYPFYR